MKQLIALVMIILAVMPAAMLAGCTSNGTDRPTADTLLDYVSGVCGFTVRLNVSVKTTISAVYTDGDLHYRTYHVDTHVERYATPVPVATRNLSNPRISTYSLYNNVVGLWEGTPWNYWIRDDDSLPSQHYTSVQTGESESDPVYEIPKPGMYIQALGHTLTFHEIMLTTQEQVATYLKVRLQDDGSGNMLPYEFKIPFEGIIPEWTYAGNIKTVWFDVELYCPVGGALFEAVPDFLEVICYDTHQTFKAGYTQTVYSITGPDWQDWLVSAYLSTFCPTAGLGYLFGVADWGAETYVEVGSTIRPHGLEALDNTPDSSEIGRSFGIAVQMW